MKIANSPVFFNLLRYKKNKILIGSSIFWGIVKFFNMGFTNAPPQEFSRIFFLDFPAV